MQYWTEDDDPVNICYDNVFKSVFTKDIPASRKALSELVSAITGRSLSIVAINANEPAVDGVFDRQIRFDISCKSHTGELVNVEMTLTMRKCENVRIEYYGSKHFTAQDIRGADKIFDDLRMAYHISFIVNGRLIADEEFFHEFEYYDKKRHISLDGRSRLFTVELSKLEKIVDKPAGLMDAVEKWAVYFRYLTDKAKRGKINDIIEREEGIKMANEVLITISRDDVERARLFSEYKYEVDRQNDLISARREGMAQGLSQGMAQGQNYVLNLLEQGCSLEEIKRRLSGPAAY